MDTDGMAVTWLLPLLHRAEFCGVIRKSGAEMTLQKARRGADPLDR